MLVVAGGRGFRSEPGEEPRPFLACSQIPATDYLLRPRAAAILLGGSAAFGRRLNLQKGTTKEQMSSHCVECARLGCDNDCTEHCCCIQCDDGDHMLNYESK